MLLSMPLQTAALYMQQSWYTDWWIAWYLPVLPAIYVDGRISLVLPATAVGERSNIVESWRMTRGNGLDIAAALLIATIATALVGISVRWLIGDFPHLARLVSNMLNFPLVAVAVGIISVTYRELSKE